MSSSLSDHSSQSSSLSSKVNLLGLSPSKMIDFFVTLGEKPFRARQVLQWIHQHGVNNIDAMTTISKALRTRLRSCAVITAPTIVSQQDSADGTRKWMMRVSGGSLIETVLIPENNRATLCISSQVGCRLDCSFCSTGKQGFQRDLTPAEIIGQLWLAIRSYDGFMNHKKYQQRTVTNVVMMGMGEPLLNFDHVVDAMQLMLNDLAYGLSKRRVTLSTAGVVPAIDRLGDVSEVSLAISLHAPNDALRNILVPLNRRFPIAELLAAARRYLDKQSDQRRVITIEYTMIAGVNDSTELAIELAKLLENFPCKINLIPFNPFSLSDYQKPSGNTVKRFAKILTDAGFMTTIRTTRGDDIDAACGQLVGQFLDKTKRKQRYIQKKDCTREAELIPVQHL